MTTTKLQDITIKFVTAGAHCSKNELCNLKDNLIHRLVLIYLSWIEKVNNVSMFNYSVSPFIYQAWYVFNTSPPEALENIFMNVIESPEPTFEIYSGMLNNLYIIEEFILAQNYVQAPSYGGISK